MKFKWLTIIIILLTATFCINASFLLTIPTKTEEPTTSTSNYIPASDYTLPTIHISLEDTDLETIIHNSKDIKYEDNSLSITVDSNTIDYTNVEIKGRGNSTWGLPKSPFQIKFDSKVDLLGLGKAKKWVLLANIFDKSNLRNDIAFYIERLLDMEYALDGKFVELYIDNDYLGLYYLTEKVEIGKERVDVTDDNSVLVELENLHSNIEPCDAITEEQTCLVLKDSYVEALEQESFNLFLKNFNALEQAAKAGDFETVKELADVDSFAKYYILSDITVNPDAYASSFYFYQKNNKIYAGPGWDFDLALGNRVWVWARTEDFYLPETARIVEKYAFGGTVYDESTNQYTVLTPDGTIARFVFWLYQIPEFQDKIKQIYQDYILNKKDDIISYIKSKVGLIKSSAICDRKLWREYDNNTIILGDNATELAPKILYTNLSVKDAFDAEIENLLDWVSRRLNFLNSKYDKL